MLDSQFEEQDGTSPATDIRFTTTTTTYVHGLYHDVVGENDVDGFLDSESSLYSTAAKQWNIPEAVKDTDDLVKYVFTILSSILHRFVKPPDPGVERHLVDTTPSPGCCEKNEDGYRTCPVLIVRASGPSFELPWTDDPEVRAQTTNETLGFTRIATYFVVKPEAELGDVGELVEEVSYYAKYVLYPISSRIVGLEFTRRAS